MHLDTYVLTYIVESQQVQNIHLIPPFCSRFIYHIPITKSGLLKSYLSENPILIYFPAPTFEF